MLLIVKYIIDFIFSFLNTLNFTIFSFNDVDVGFLSFVLSCYIIVKLFKFFLDSDNIGKGVNEYSNMVKNSYTPKHTYKPKHSSKRGD